MPFQDDSYNCDFYCGENFEDYDECVEHEKSCGNNPNLKSCGTCQNIVGNPYHFGVTLEHGFDLLIETEGLKTLEEHPLNVCREGLKIDFDKRQCEKYVYDLRESSSNRLLDTD